MPQVVEAKPINAPRRASSALHALIRVARRLGVEISYEELRRNYALADGEPETRMLIAIARDFGIDGRVVRVNFNELPRLGKSLPAILRVQDGGALVLEGAHAHPKMGPVAAVSDPLAADAAAVAVDEAKLGRVWSGEVILLKRRQSITDEERPFGMAWLIGQVLRERRLFIDIAAGAIVSTIFALAPPLVFMIVVNRVLVNHSMSTLQVLGGAIGLMIVFEMILLHLRRRLTEIATARIDARLNLYLLEKLLKLPISYFEHNPTGRIVSKIGRMWHVRNFLTGQLFGTFLEAVPLIGLVPVLFILEWRLASQVVALGVCVFVIVLLFLKPLGRRYARVVKAEQARYSHLVETISGMRTIKALALEGRRRREWDAHTAETIESKLSMGHLAAMPPTLTLPFERLMYSGSFIVGSYMALTMADSLNAGTLGAFAMLAMRIGSPLVQIARLQLDLAEARGALTELATVMNATSEETREHAGSRQPIKGGVSFESVRFRYGSDSLYALDGINFEVRPGMSLGIMGRSGSGKTTITRLLQCLHANYEGLIKIDGIDLRAINLTHLRTNIGVVLQENFLFTGSIRDNIAIARPDASFAQIVRAAQLAGAEEFIERMPRGYDTLLEEGASNLSGGQRQRLAIARALLSDPPILILDEATSALDAESEAIINANLRRITHGRTVISISHRLSMLVDYDAIMVLDRGKIYDIGTHDELLDRCDIYKHLWYQQNRHMDRSPRTVAMAAIGNG